MRRHAQERGFSNLQLWTLELIHRDQGMIDRLSVDLIAREVVGRSRNRQRLHATLQRLRHRRAEQLRRPKLDLDLLELVGKLHEVARRRGRWSGLHRSVAFEVGKDHLRLICGGGRAVFHHRDRDDREGGDE